MINEKSFQENLKSKKLLRNFFAAQCNRCSEKGIYKAQHQTLCKSHFLAYFEGKVFRTINKYGLFSPDDKICVAVSGGKDSITVLYLTMIYCKEHNLDFFALTIDEGIRGYRDKTIKNVESFCKKHDIPLHIISFKEKIGSTLDQMKDKALNQLNKKPCTVCGIFRRKYLNQGSRELGATKLVTGHNLDDESQSFFMNLLLGNMRHNAALGPITGLSENKKFVPRVKPLYFVSEKETRLYTFLKGFDVDFNECPNINLSFRAVVRDKLNEIEAQMPGAKNSIVNAFLEILPTLKELYRGKKSFSYCEHCGDPCAGTICNACKMEEELKMGIK